MPEGLEDVQTPSAIPLGTLPRCKVGEGGREGGRERGREGEREEGSEGGREEGREGGRERGREGEREGGREGEGSRIMKNEIAVHNVYAVATNVSIQSCTFKKT